MAKTLEQLGQDYNQFNPSEDDGILRIIQNWGNELIKQFQINLQTKKSYQGKRGSYSSNTIATGQLYERIEPTIRSKKDGYNVSVTMMSYWRYVEYGRPPTSGGGNGQVYKNIYEWLSYKKDFRNDPRKRKSLAAAISKKIHREGTKPKPFIIPAMKEVTTATLAERIGKYIASSLGE